MLREFGVPTNNANESLNAGKYFCQPGNTVTGKRKYAPLIGIVIIIIII